MSNSSTPHRPPSGTQQQQQQQQQQATQQSPSSSPSPKSVPSRPLKQLKSHASSNNETNLDSRNLHFIHINANNSTIKQVFATNVSINIWLDSVRESIYKLVNKQFKLREEFLTKQLKQFQGKISQVKERIKLKAKEKEEEAIRAEKENAANNPNTNVENIANNNSKTTAVAAHKSKVNSISSISNPPILTPNPPVTEPSLPEHKSSQSKRVVKNSGKDSSVAAIVLDPDQQEIADYQIQIEKVQSDLNQVAIQSLLLQSDKYQSNSTLDVVDGNGVCMNLRHNLHSRVNKFVKGGGNYTLAIVSESDGNVNVQPVVFSSIATPITTSEKGV